MRPCAAFTSATIACTRSTSRTSTAIALALLPDARIWAAAASTRSSLRLASTTWAPRDASSSAMPSPMPLPPPGTSATCPSKRPGRKTPASCAGGNFSVMPEAPGRERVHQSVACPLRHDRRASHRVTARVSADDRRVLDAEGADAVSVDDHVIRCHGQPLNRAAHGEHRRMVDVQPVDLTHAGSANRERETAFTNADGELVAHRRGKRLRVVHSADGLRIRRHDERTCDDGARERAPSDFIDTREKRPAGVAQLALDPAPAATAPRHKAVPRALTRPRRARSWPSFP